MVLVAHDFLSLGIIKGRVTKLCFSNYQWLQLYPIATVDTFPILSSDHAPILPNIGYKRVHAKHNLFKFEAKFELFYNYLKFFDHDT